MAPIRPIPLLISFFFVQIVLCVFAQQNEQYMNISLGSTLSSSKNSSWVSVSGEFAFGFYEPIAGQKLYLLGIWFNKIRNRTLVWTANRDDPVGEGSTLELTEAGDLILFDSHRNQKWSADKSTLGSVAKAAMLDSGNFVLLNASSQPVWQSFDSPTDTLLPGQTLKRNSTMFSRASPQNYSTGRFVLHLEEDGNLVLYPADRPDKSDGIYWSSNTQSTSGDNPLMFDESGRLLLANGNETIPILNTGYAGDESVYHRVTLDFDGVLREYEHERDVESSWSTYGKALQDPCRVKSLCGMNGYCTLQSGETVCKCPPGFNPVDKQDAFKGCHRNAPTSCNARSKMEKMENTDWRGGADYWHFLSMNESECQQACLDDCECVVVIFWNGNCWKKTNPLLDGRQALDVNDRTAFVKVSDDDDATISKSCSHKRKSRALFVSGVALLGCFAVLVVAAIMVLVYRSRVKRRSSFKDGENKFTGGLQSFTYKQIEGTTGGFKEQLGMGAFGKVYKGLLSDGRPIAVKKLEKLVEDGEKEFRTEVAIIGITHHKNLVQLLGFCDEDSYRILVYEYMSNRSLDSLLFNQKHFLSWDLRVQIAIGTAKGIAYLHEECGTQIIHCDIKPQNILLDDGYNPKISDFGLGKLMGAEQTRTFTRARGTRGYLAPEWQKNVPITVKVDVYSFGMMLLEIICCRKNIRLDVPESEISLSDWVYECWRSGRLEALVEKQQQAEDNRIDGRQLERMALVGLWCIQDDPTFRPSMKRVVHMLEGSVEIPVPPPISSLL
eukprot:Gb_05527 [translate_table: standard]